MKSSLLAVCLTASALLLISLAPRGDAHGARAAGPQEEDLQKRVALLEEQVAELMKANEEKDKGIDEVLKFLDAQAASCKTFAAVLDQSEALGFTQGINFESREVMLAGWRAHLAVMEKVPDAKKLAGDGTGNVPQR